jgi:K(+)-stimulated pyrophosphate-energized sodium pump
MLGGYMAGVTVSGVLWAIFQNNAGGAWDNAKKSFEAGVEINGKMTFKGSEAHKASVTGDTVGDPFKDTSGPSMNILIKLTCLIGLVIAPILGGHSMDSIQNTIDRSVNKEVIIEAQNDVWTMKITTDQRDPSGSKSDSEIITGTKEEIINEAKKMGVNDIDEFVNN